MITKFNLYEHKINEDNTLPSWVDEKIVKPAGGLFDQYGKPLLSIPGTEKNEIDENLKKLYNTPIANIPVYAYAQLMDIMDEDRVDDIKLEPPLNKDSAMLDVAINYYINNIVNIIQSADKVDVMFNPDGINKEVSDALNMSPVTIGTIIRNSLIDWYLSKDPENKIVESLNKAVLEVREEDTKVSESFDSINEGKYSASFEGIERLSKWASKFLKGSGELKGSSNTAKEVSTIAKEIKSASSTDDALKQIDELSGNFSKKLDDAPAEVKNAINQRTSNLQQQAKDIPTPKTPETPETPKIKTETTNIESGKPKIPDSNASGDSGKKDEAKGFFEKMKEARNKAKDKNKNLPPKDPKKIKLFEKLRKALTSTFKGIVKFFTLGGFLLKVPKYAWTIVKYGGIAYGVYWVAKWFEKQDSESALEPTRELLSIFEKDLAHRKYEPFIFFDDLGERFKKSSEAGDIREQFKAWCESLFAFEILSDSDYKKCIDQIESDSFQFYMEATSTASANFINKLQGEWASVKELPSIGLLTMGLASAYSSVFHKFENEFYKGKIPLTADAKNLDKPIGITTRVDAEGKERKFLQIGDEGEDVKLLQSSLSRLNLYSGEIDGKYDEDLAKVITLIQTNAKPTNTEIEINGKADLPVLNYLAKQIGFLSGLVAGSIEGTVTKEEYEKRQQTQGYIQQMQAALANR